MCDTGVSDWSLDPCDDDIRGDRGSDQVRAAPGDDRVRGGRGDTRSTVAVGATGCPVAPGPTCSSAARANDRITSVDGVRDVVRCGPGLNDRLVADRRDRVVGCERVVRR